MDRLLLRLGLLLRLQLEMMLLHIGHRSVKIVVLGFLLLLRLGHLILAQPIRHLVDKRGRFKWWLAVCKMLEDVL